jgi:quercetin dioxygenase-like cupin family protein
MTLKMRRVVTGHDKNGKAMVKIDELVKNVVQSRPGASASVIWSTDKFPVDNTDEFDGAQRKVGTSVDTGVVFRVVKFDPGVSPRNHRTDSLDCAVVLSGEIDMVLDDTTVRLKAGDALVQRGTVHNWINNGKEPCVIAFVLVGAKPVTVDGKTLHAHG